MASDMSDDELFLLASQEYEELDSWVGDINEQDDVMEQTESGSNIIPDDDDDDKLFLVASQQYEETLTTNQFMEQEDESASKATGKKRFASPISESDIMRLIDDAIPANTQKTTLWAVRTWKDWATQRKENGDEVPCDLEVATNEDINKWLARFVLEVRNQRGECYTGATIYSLCAGLQRHICDVRMANKGKSLDIYTNCEFTYFRSVLDSVLKQLHKQGVGTVKKRAEGISHELEDHLWKSKVLGDDTPQKLLDTLVFCFGLNLALRSGQEHRDLRPDMLVLSEPPGAKAYLTYTESGSKNNSGGLRDRRVANKSVKVFENPDNRSMCVVTLYKKYMSLRPEEPKDVFYLQPLTRPRHDRWYQARPVGHNKLSQTVKRLCESSGVDGYYTNHSLRRTAATRMEPMSKRSCQ